MWPHVCSSFIYSLSRGWTGSRHCHLWNSYVVLSHEITLKFYTRCVDCKCVLHSVHCVHKSTVRYLLWHFKQQRRQIRAYKKSTFIKQPFDFGRNNMCKKVPQVYIIYEIDVKPYIVRFAWKTCFVYVCNTEVFLLPRNWHDHSISAVYRM